MKIGPEKRKAFSVGIIASLLLCPTILIGTGFLSTAFLTVAIASGWYARKVGVSKLYILAGITFVICAELWVGIKFYPDPVDPSLVDVLTSSSTARLFPGSQRLHDIILYILIYMGAFSIAVFLIDKVVQWNFPPHMGKIFLTLGLTMVVLTPLLDVFGIAAAVTVTIPIWLTAKKSIKWPAAAVTVTALCLPILLLTQTGSCAFLDTLKLHPLWRSDCWGMMSGFNGAAFPCWKNPQNNKWCGDWFKQKYHM